MNALNGAERWNGLNVLNQEFVNREEATRLVHTTREEKMSSEIFRFFGTSRRYLAEMETGGFFNQIWSDKR